jgi:uncharacterized membrane protein YbaN (DUF454 family)
MQARAGIVGTLSIKLAVCIAVLGLVVLGAIGLVLPLIPGFLFLGIAAVLVARYFPRVSERLRSSDTLGPHLDRADGLLGLSAGDKVRLGVLVGAKLVADGLAALRDLAKGLIGSLRARSR